MSFIRMMNEKQDETGTAQVSDVADSDSFSVFAATDATFVECDSTQDRVVRHEKSYHRLTPEYWAWFRHKYELMENAVTRKKISEAAFEKILDRISALYNQAVEIFGKDALDRACETTDIAAVDEMIKSGNDAVTVPRRPRRPSLVAERGRQPVRKNAVPAGAQANAPARSQAAAKVDAVRDRAITLGWSHDQLYRTDGIAYRDWGLVRFLGENDEIGEITTQYIEIKNAKARNSLRFYNNEVDQPWVRRVGGKEDACNAIRECG